MTDTAVVETSEELLAPRTGVVVAEVLLLPLRPDSGDLFGAWVAAGVAPEVRVLVGVRGGEVIAVAGVEGFTREAHNPSRVIFQRSNKPLDLPWLVGVLGRDVHNLRMWGGPRRLEIVGE